MQENYRLDLKDIKIILELDYNSRQPFAEIAKKLRLSKEVVAYRYNQLVQKGILSKLITLVSLGRLGFYTHKLYLQMRGLSKEQEDNLIKDLLEDPDIMWVSTSHGPWNLLVAFYSRTVVEFNKKKLRFLFKYGRHISEYSYSTLCEASVVRRKYLLPEYVKSRDIKLFIGGEKQTSTSIDDIDKRILIMLSDNTRLSALEISKTLKMNVKTVTRRISELERTGIIQGYTINLDLNKLGFRYFKPIIYLHNFSETRYKQMIEYCKNIPFVVHVLETAGPWELELEIETRTNEEYYSMMRELENEFSDNIRKIETIIITNEARLDFIPKELL